MCVIGNSKQSQFLAQKRKNNKRAAKENNYIK
jgi:hypothetical protein